MTPIPASELIINPNGSIYHLHLLPEQVADTIITVGDPDRVGEVSKHFDSIECRVQHREFVTHTGRLGTRRLTVLSTGIGTDNIDIVLNELDALVNIDFSTRLPKTQLSSLDIVRLGTSGTIQADIALDTIVLSSGGIGLDSLMAFYQQQLEGSEQLLIDAFHAHIHHSLPSLSPYLAMADRALLGRFSSLGVEGLTITAPGFYAPQGRRLRSQNTTTDLIGLLHQFQHLHHRITNVEMETAGIYALGQHLGHRCLSISAILAHRIHNSFSPNPQKIVDQMIERALGLI